MQEIKARNSYCGVTPYHKGQRDNVQRLEEASEGVGMPKGNARGVFGAVDGGHQTDQVVCGRSAHCTWRHD